jgi:phosphate transport system substrate-binding protein
MKDRRPTMIRGNDVSPTRLAALVALVTLGAGAVGCGDGGAGAGALRGTIEIDGSSTVFPITEAVAEEFMLQAGRGVRVTVGESGTGGGFKRFCAGETAIANASRKIKESEREACAQSGVEFVEIPVAYDGISVVVHPDNTFVDCLTIDELRRIWEPGSQVRSWADVRAGWPARELHLYGPGTDSGTFDYFTEAVVGEEDASRADFTASEDDNVLVQGVSGDPNGLGYFGYAYYEQNKERLKLVSIDAGEGCIAPSAATIRGGSYRPLSRPMFIYVNRKAFERPEVADFVRFYLESAGQLVPEVGYIPLGAEQYGERLRSLDRAGRDSTI